MNAAAPQFSIIIPAYNEAEHLPRTLTHLLRALSELPQPGEVIVVNNNSTDATGEIAAACGARVVCEPINQISRARNAGAAVARGRYLIFTDADTCPPVVTLAAALAALASGDVIGGGALVRFETRPHWSVIPLMNFWNAFAPRLKWAAGCFVFCRADAFAEIGGFSLRVYASEELWFSKALRELGARRRQRFLVIRRPRVVTSARKLDQPSRMWRHLLLLIFAPWLVRSREHCPWWYKRP